VYAGFPDLREKIEKDYYAISKEELRIILAQAGRQNAQLVPENGQLVVQELKSKFEPIDRELLEVARLAKKAERTIGPSKLFFSMKQESVELLWANRLGFDIMVKEEPAQVAEAKPDDFLMQDAEASPQPNAAQGQVAAKLLGASLDIVRQVVERKYRGAFGETPADVNIADMVNRLNDASTFSRSVDGALLLQAQEAARNESTLTEKEYAKTIEEVAFLMTYA
jgi:hypothetical protein